MAIAEMMGFETGAAGGEVNGGAFTGTGLSFDTLTVRTGTRSLKCAAPSGTASAYSVALTAQAFHRFYVRFTALPATTARRFYGFATSANLSINANGTVSFTNNGTLIGTSSVALTDTTKWYQINCRVSDGSSVSVLDIDGVSAVTGSPSTWTMTAVFGSSTDTVADTFTCYYDDWAIGTSAVASGKCVLLLPTADSAVGTGWTLGTGTAIASNSGSTAVKNTPPVGVADLTAGSDTKQIRNATSNANVNYDATMTTYSAAGIAAADTVNAVLPFVLTGAPVVTSAKAGTVGIASNPAVANVALGAGGTAGAFWSGTAAGTFPTGWKNSRGTFTLAPSVTVGTAPVMRITQVTSSTRIAIVCFMGIYVDFTPAATSQFMLINTALGAR